MGKGYQWKRIFLSPGKTKLNKTFEHSSWGEKNILNFCEGNILVLSLAWNFFLRNQSVSPFSHKVLSQDGGLWHGDGRLFRGHRVVKNPGEGDCRPARPELTATSGAPQCSWLMHSVFKFLLISLVLWESCSSSALLQKHVHFHYQSRYQILGALEDILSGTFPGAIFQPCG